MVLKLVVVSFIIALVAVVLSQYYFVENKLLSKVEIQIVSDDPSIERYLSVYKDTIGTADYLGYRNHIYRVYTYALHFIRIEGTEKDIETYRNSLGYALVYHDIGLWADKNIAYLEPSINRALNDIDKLYNDHTDLVQNKDLIENIIKWHHKITPYEGPFSLIVNAARRGDWIDASMGVVHHGMPSIFIEKAQKQIINAGFHNTLLSFASGSRLHSFNFLKANYELVSSIMKW